MKRLVLFPLKEGGSVLIEVDEPETGGSVRASRGDIVDKAKGTFEDALSQVMPAINGIVTQLRSAINQTDEVELTFGLKLNVDANAIIASAGTEANFGVTVHWKNKDEARGAT